MSNNVNLVLQCCGRVEAKKVSCENTGLQENSSCFVELASNPLMPVSSTEISSSKFVAIRVQSAFLCIVLSAAPAAPCAVGSKAPVQLPPSGCSRVEGYRGEFTRSWMHIWSQQKSELSDWTCVFCEGEKYWKWLLGSIIFLFFLVWICLLKNATGKNPCRNAMTVTRVHLGGEQILDSIS